MKMRYVTGNISMYHSGSNSRFSRGAQLPFSSLTAPTLFGIPVQNEEETDRQRELAGVAVISEEKKRPL